MKVFIGWSGDRSKKCAEIFEEFLPLIMHNCQPYFSPETDKGTQWFEVIGKELADSNIGIFCITQDNVDNQWILFESGALSKGDSKARVCLFLLDLKKTNITGPLKHFQATSNKEEEIYRLIKTINKGNEEPLDEIRLQRVFDTYWNEINKKLKAIPKDKETRPKKKQSRDTDEVLDEILEIVRAERFEKPLVSTAFPKDFPDISSTKDINWNGLELILIKGVNKAKFLKKMNNIFLVPYKEKTIRLNSIELFWPNNIPRKIFESYYNYFLASGDVKGMNKMIKTIE